MTALYLTQVRALTVMAALGVLVFAAVRLRQGRILQGGWIAVGGVALVAASFMWAAAIGGKAIEDRFSGLIDNGPLHHVSGDPRAVSELHLARAVVPVSARRGARAAGE